MSSTQMARSCTPFITSSKHGFTVSHGSQWTETLCLTSLQSTTNYSRASPIVCQTPPEYLYSGPAPYEPARYDFVGVPLEPPQPKTYIIYDDDEDQGPSTAEIIANQSQDYVDEKLAEYQMTIMQLQGKWKHEKFSWKTCNHNFRLNSLRNFLKIYEHLNNSHGFDIKMFRERLKST